MEISDMEAELHRIESEAYGAVLRALTAQGGPTWEHLDTLYGLRKELRITEAENRDLIARAKSDKQWRQGTLEEKKLPLNNAKPPHVVSSTSQASSKRMTTFHVPEPPFSCYQSDAQPPHAALSPSLAPLATPISSSLAVRMTTVGGGEAGVFSSRESAVRPKNTVCFKKQASIVSKGMTIIQSKSGNQLANIGIAKKKWDRIEIPVTSKLIFEVERLVNCRNHPDEARIEKAKSLLKDQEKAIIEALGKLAELIELPDNTENCGQQQRNERTPLIIYGHPIEKMKGGYYNTEGVSRYIETP